MVAITAEVITEILSKSPRISIAIFSILVTFISSLVQKWLTNQENLKKMKERQKEIQKEIKNTKEPTAMQELNAEMMKISMTMMKSSFKPMLVTMIPFILLFGWLRSIYVPLLGNSWIWYYLGYSLVASFLIRKLLKMA